MKPSRPHSDTCLLSLRLRCLHDSLALLVVFLNYSNKKKKSLEQKQDKKQLYLLFFCSNVTAGNGSKLVLKGYKRGIKS